ARLAARLGEPGTGAPEMAERAGPDSGARAGADSGARAGADSGPVFRLVAAPSPGTPALGA
ncbi:hypothetical protein ABZS78_34790, partial [Streptomyces decoyicus]